MKATTEDTVKLYGTALNTCHTLSAGLSVQTGRGAQCPKHRKSAPAPLARTTAWDSRKLAGFNGSSGPAAMSGREGGCETEEATMKIKVCPHKQGESGCRGYSCGGRERRRHKGVRRSLEQRKGQQEVNIRLTTAVWLMPDGRQAERTMCDECACSVPSVGK